MDFDHTENKDSNETLDSYWTPERKKNAKPRAYDGRSWADREPKEVVPGDPKTYPGQEPIDKKQEFALFQGTIPVLNPTEFPWCTTGKLFLRLGGVDGYGGACVIGKNLLLTAAHLLYDASTEEWSSHIRFEPAYANGKQPFGYWYCEKSFVPEGWSKGLGLSYDLGVVRTKKGGLKELDVGDVVGCLEYKVNCSTKGQWYEVGYPHNHFEGELMMMDLGWLVSEVDDDKIIGKNSSFGRGASGSPWLEYPVTNNVVNGCTSHSDDDRGGEAYSVYFADWVKEFIGKCRDYP
ncbi:MAG: hypothetical protein JO235_26925 [Chroococcidiopsidaceae cyanobacterium CP_BM_RX_35]|nr:hypothetical protein [Chroococcidiopsidaceae cyanobacterium CP_BM_RX_35]